MISTSSPYNTPDPWSAIGPTNTGSINPYNAETFAVGSLSPYGTGIPLDGNATSMMPTQLNSTAYSQPASGYYPEYANTPSWQNTQNYTDASKTATWTDASSKIFALNNYYEYYLTLKKDCPPPPPPLPPTPPTPPTPTPLPLPELPRCEPEKKENNWLPWVIGGGGVLLACLLGRKKDEPNVCETKTESKVCKTETEAEVCETETETTDKKDVIRVNFSGYGDPKFKDARTGKVIDITKAGQHTLVKDKNSTLNVHMTKDTNGNVYMDGLNYTVSGSTIQADDSGNVSVDGKAVKIGSSAELVNGGSVKVVEGTKSSTTNKNGKATIIIKTATGELMTAFIQKRKTDGKPYYEFNFSKNHEEGDSEETVTSGELKPFFDEAASATVEDSIW
jgi:hypothetical protein